MLYHRTVQTLETSINFKAISKPCQKLTNFRKTPTHHENHLHDYDRVHPASTFQTGSPKAQKLPRTEFFFAK